MTTIAPVFPGDHAAYADQAPTLAPYPAQDSWQRRDKRPGRVRKPNRRPGAITGRAAGHVRQATGHPVRTLKTVGHTCRYLWTVRAAIPWPVKAILAVAMILKCLPLDFLADETLTVIAAVILQKTRPGLLKACYRAAQIRA